jgi:hypothetical protein
MSEQSINPWAPLGQGQFQSMQAHYDYLIIDLQKRVYALEREVHAMKVVRKPRKPQ